MLFLAGLFMFFTFLAATEIKDKDNRVAFVMLLMALSIIFAMNHMYDVAYEVGYETAMSELQTRN